MKHQDIRRPQNIEFNDLKVRVELSVPTFIYDDEDNLLDILIAPTLVLPDGFEGLVTELPISSQMFDEDIYKNFVLRSNSIARLNRLAELNLDTLIGVIERYFAIHPVDEVLDRNADCRVLREYNIQENFSKLTFGNLRNILSCIIKTDPDLQVFEGLKSKEDRKNYTTVYKNYIEDRDSFTHGILFFLSPDFIPVLRIKSQTGSFKYVSYDKPIFTDNLLTYKYLTSILDHINLYLQSKIEGSIAE
ncbi:hypothetical protein [Dyadobacter sandarakinus]|uniref:Uncharacterized protein n=1 Tax=Dyadobacter sandarakinus TaxID=2747268 RepID=A0ABX7I618_9BACT|nr:hypothetical protein [Dyadobacter sandarakinus]QRR01546.1 hypothetical protein HWI92_11830 [Dyadobacter sandarakinus]